MAPSFPRQNQGVVLRDTGTPLGNLWPTGLSPSTAGLSSPLRLGCPSGTRALNPTSPHGYPARVWFGLTPFRSPLLGGSLLVSLPPPTKMFPFGGFPLRGKPRSARAYSARAGSPIQGSRVQRLPAPTPGLSQLATPFLGARAEPSTGWLAGAGGSLVKVSTTPIPLNNPSPEEVIRPQVPLRPPCYDFAPLGSPQLVLPSPGGYPGKKRPRWGLPRVARRAVCARGRDVFTARW